MISSSSEIGMNSLESILYGIFSTTRFSSSGVKLSFLGIVALWIGVRGWQWYIGLAWLDCSGISYGWVCNELNLDWGPGWIMCALFRLGLGSLGVL